MRKILVGVDESGLGAWAGPATACAVAIYEDDSQGLYEAGVRDSKVLSDSRRRALVAEILNTAIATVVVVMTEQQLSDNFRQAWRTAMLQAALRAAAGFDRPEIILDGSPDRPILRALREYGSPIRFVKQADRKFPVVGAASILAKTLRNDRMAALSERYPEYHWDQNAGYHSEVHLAAIHKHGITPAHRRIRPIRKMLHEQTAKERT